MRDYLTYISYPIPSFAKPDSLHFITFTSISIILFLLELATVKQIEEQNRNEASIINEIISPLPMATDITPENNC